jgi:geranylgeranyl pyrophosphate synthase
VARALAGEDVPDALDRVVATGAIEASRELALDYARRARAALADGEERETLEPLTHVVVDRET